MLIQYCLPIPPPGLQSAILEQGQAHLFVAAVKAGVRARGRLWKENEKDPQPAGFNLSRSPASSRIDLDRACLGRLDLQDPFKKAHLARCDCDKCWPGFPQQKRSPSVRGRVHANSSCWRKRSAHPHIAQIQNCRGQIERHGQRIL